jgi:hypothetical protein
MWGQLAPPIGRPAPRGGPRLSASRTFLLPTPRLHLRRPSSRFDPRAHVGPLVLYNQAWTPEASSHLRSSLSEPKTLISLELL